jgi:hypothetical protein
MGRVFFPTVSLNRFGVRDTNQQATLGGDPARFPAEPTPRAAANPTGSILGGVGFVRAVVGDGIVYPGAGFVPRAPIRYYNDGPYVVGPVSVPPVIYGQTATPPAPPLAIPLVQTINSSGGGGATAPAAPAPSPAATPVSSQVGPTPTANVQQPAPTGAVLVSSGGGTQTPATAVVAAPTSAGSIVDGIAAWLGGTTALMNYNVPNALLAGVVVLGFAWLSSGSSGKKR